MDKLWSAWRIWFPSRPPRGNDVCGFCGAAEGHWPSCPLYGK